MRYQIIFRRTLFAIEDVEADTPLAALQQLAEGTVTEPELGLWTGPSPTQVVVADPHRRSRLPPLNWCSGVGSSSAVDIQGWDSEFISLPQAMLRTEAVPGLLNSFKTANFQMLIRRRLVNAQNQPQQPTLVLTAADPPMEDWFADELSLGVSEIAFLSDFLDGGLVFANLRRRHVRVIVESPLAIEFVERLKKGLKDDNIRVGWRWRSGTYGYPGLLAIVLAGVVLTISDDSKTSLASWKQALEGFGATLAWIGLLLLLTAGLLQMMGSFFGKGIRVRPTWSETRQIKIGLHGLRFRALRTGAPSTLAWIVVAALVTYLFTRLG